MFDNIAKALIFFGILLVLLGGIFFLAQKFTWIGKLPGDIHIKKDNFSFHFPIVTCLIVSIAFSFIMAFLGKR